MVALWQFLPAAFLNGNSVASPQIDPVQTLAPSVSLPPPSQEITTATDREHMKSIQQENGLPAISPRMAKEIQRLSNHGNEGLTQTTNPDGSVTMHTQNHFQSVLVGVRDANGNIIMRHGEEFLPNVKSQ